MKKVLWLILRVIVVIVYLVLKVINVLSTALLNGAIRLLENIPK